MRAKPAAYLDFLPKEKCFILSQIKKKKALIPRQSFGRINSSVIVLTELSVMRITKYHILAGYLLYSGFCENSSIQII